jgi:phosphoribosyl-AMP cyclohydrolase
VNFPSEIQERFLKDELVAAIAQESSTGQVLMLAWMNQEALEKTIQTNQVTYWSRSRNSLWVKGETSGNTQELISISYDCDGDAILLKVHQQGAACHTGERTCFHRELNS